MNSLNILSARVSPPQTPAPSRTNSYGNALSLAGSSEVRRNAREDANGEKAIEEDDPVEDIPVNAEKHGFPDEHSPLIGTGRLDPVDSKVSSGNSISKYVASAIINSLRWVVSTLAAPGVYLIACLYDEGGRFVPFYHLWPRKQNRSTSPAQAHETIPQGENNILIGSRNGKENFGRRSLNKSSKRLTISSSSSSGLSSESESERDRPANGGADEDGSASPSNHTRSKSLHSSDEIAPARRSIRIKLHADDSLRQRKHRKAQSAISQNANSGTLPAAEISPATLKSPTSPAASLLITKYPRAPAPPRPLIPRRQPSYTNSEANHGRLAQKTLILDLDETLIHSMAKGGRMSTGHMVEVKLNTYIGVAGQASIGPQHPILYYVHKRPFCDEFLRRVCKWYNLVVFTASVQEYADPVIDWLEQEKKFFSGRFYRQHCTYRNGAFIKDLSSVEPDLSKVMILDNSPLSYMFHQDNAIPIEGWINDPTDNDLLHLVPLLEGLQHVTDVRALLALRGGEDGKHMVA